MSSIVTQLGSFGVFLLMIPESAGIPLPSEVTLLAAGFAVRQGAMPFWLAVVAATAGNLIGSLIAYAIGRYASGRDPGNWVQRGLTRCDAVFVRHGTRAVLLARLMPLARTFVSLPAGHARVALGPFILMTVAGCTVWATAFVLVGIVLGSGWTALSGPIGNGLLLVGALAIVAAAHRAARSAQT